MKFKIILLILTILLNNCISVANKSKIENRRLHKSHNHKNLSASQAKGVTEDLFNTIVEIFKSPSDYLIQFVIGALSAYDQHFEILFESYKKIKAAVKECQAKIIEANEDPTVRKFTGSDIEIRLNNTDPAKKKEFCEQCQKTTEDWKTKFSINKNGDNWFGKVVGETYTVFSAKARTCGYVAEQLTGEGDRGKFKVDQSLKNDLLHEFKTLENWELECKYIMSLDCNNYNPQYAGVKTLGEKVYKFWKKVGAGFECMSSDKTKDALKPILGQDNINKIYGNSMINGVKTIFGGVVGAAANVFTLGIWGAVKGAFYLVKVGKLIYEIADKNKGQEMRSYLAGKITGNLIIMLKSFAFGKKKHKKLRNKN